MRFFRRLALHRFIKQHPPASDNQAVSAELIAAYDGILPTALLELWRKKGLGFYGNRQLALINPQEWQPVLDDWTSHPDDDVLRIPIALTPFGTLLYFRQLTPTDVDIATCDPVAKTSDVLSWNLEEFFNHSLCQEGCLEFLCPADLLAGAKEQCGHLMAGEVYNVDEMLKAMHILQFSRTNALLWHQQLLAAALTSEPTAEAPTTVADALPEHYREQFIDLPNDNTLSGLYLSCWLDWHRLLALYPNGEYKLLFWCIDYYTFERQEMRFYQGKYDVGKNQEGDSTLQLEIMLHAGSLGSDARDEHLLVMNAGQTCFLLREDELDDIADDIADRDVLGKSEYYFRRVALTDQYHSEPNDGCTTPPYEELAKTLQKRVRSEPLFPTIVEVAPPNTEEEEEGQGTIMCTLNLGEDDGLRMNMPLYSLTENERQFHGWIWVMAPHACKVGISYLRNDQGEIENMPQVGDILTTRRPQ